MPRIRRRPLPAGIVPTTLARKKREARLSPLSAHLAPTLAELEKRGVEREVRLALLPERGTPEWREALEAAMWDGDASLCSDLAPCKCCCSEHTFESCPARLWHGCRGQDAMTVAEEVAWQRHYEERHGMTEDDFWAW
jgi:hypothetical protein